MLRMKDMLNTNFVWYSKGDAVMKMISYTSRALDKVRAQTQQGNLFLGKIRLDGCDA